MERSSSSIGPIRIMLKDLGGHGGNYRQETSQIGARSGKVCPWPGGCAEHNRRTPTFDHGTAFGSGLGETKIAQIVSEDGTADWCRNGLTKRFDGGSRIDLVELASTALLLASQPAREYWTQRIESLELAHCESIIASCSKMSEPTRIFVHTVLETNRRRLIDVLH